MNINDLLRGGTLCLSKAGAAIGGTTTKVKSAAPNGAGIDFAIDGIMYHKADADNIWTLSGDDQTALYSRIYLLQLNASGTMSIVQGEEVLTANVTDLSDVLVWPAPTADTCVVAAVRVDAGASAFVPGTTALTGGTVTVTYYDLINVPAAPIAS